MSLEAMLVKVENHSNAAAGKNMELWGLGAGSFADEVGAAATQS